MTALQRLHARYRDPLVEIDWSRADPTLPWLPPALTPLPGLPAGRQAAFSRIEFCRLAATGIWLEGLLIHRASAACPLRRDAGEAQLMLQEIREEAGHSLMFLGVIERAGLSAVPLLGSTRLLNWVARRLDPEGAEFWAMVFVGEMVTDGLAVRALRHSASLCPAARAVLEFHHRDEARHMAAARRLLAARMAGLSGSRRQVFAMAFPWLLRCFLTATFYPTTASLAALGLPEAAARYARTDPARHALAAACTAPALTSLRRLGLRV